MFLHAIQYELGHEATITDDVPDKQAQTSIRLLQQDGFTCFRRSDTDLMELVGCAVQKTLAHTDVLPENIDALIVCTESFFDLVTPGLGRRDRVLNSLIARFGLKNAVPYGVWMTGCSNLLSALTVASGLFATQKYQNILVILADRCHPDQQRTIFNGLGYLSDGAISFIASATDGAFKIGQIIVRSGVEQSTSPNLNVLQRTRLVMTTLRDLEAMVVERTGKSFGQYRAVIGQNLHSLFYTFVCSSTSLKKHQLMFPPKLIGHTSSADHLIALDQLGNGDDERSLGGDTIGLLVAGPVSFGFIEVLSV